MNIVVPIHLEALRVSPSSGQVAMTALYDFTLLGQQPASALGDLIAANHFETAKTSLRQEPGIHLHWSLPRAYTRGTQDETTGAVRYPVVPNRWLIVRYFKDRKKATGNTRIRLWVLESDAHSSTRDGTNSPTPIPWMDNPRNLQGIQANYLGRRFDLDGAWAEPRQGIKTTGVGLAAGEVGFLGEMFQATYGYGETFTAYYPNCANVLGIWDRLDDYFPKPLVDLENDTDFAVSYAVMGWVSHTSADECNVILTRARDAWQTMTGDKPDFTAYIRGIVEQNLGWSLTNYDSLTPTTVAGIQATLGGILADVEWKIKAPGSPEYPSALPSVDEVQVAVGNNTAEALSAYLNALEQAGPGADGGRGVASNLEWLLNVLQFNQLHRLAAGEVGVGQLEEFVHGTAFAGDAGGYLWTARQKRSASPAKPTAADHEVTLPAHLAQVLSRLNRAQRALDRQRDEIATRRKQLFFDWTYHITEINTNVITGSESLGSDNSGAFLVDGLLQLFPAMLAAGNFVEAGLPAAPYAPKADAFNIQLPGDFSPVSATKLASYDFNAADNAPAAAFAQALLELGAGADALAATNLPDASAALARARALLVLYEAGGTDAGQYISDAQALLTTAAGALEIAQASLSGLSSATTGLTALAARLDAAEATLSSYIDPAAGVFATALKYQKDPGKAPLLPGETYAGAVVPPLGPLMSWDTAAGAFPGMKAQMDIFAGQDGRPPSLMDIQPAALYLGLAYFYANSKIPFKASSAYYLQMAEQTIEDAAGGARAASAALKTSAGACDDAVLAAMRSNLSQIVTQVLPRIGAYLSQARPDAAAAIKEIAVLLGEGGTEPSLPGLAAAARGADWRTMRSGISAALLTVLERLPLAQQVARWNQFLHGQIGAEFDLTAVPADHYFVPSEPVILLAEDEADGSVLAPFIRNGRAVRVPCRLDGEIVTAARAVTFPAPIAGLSGNLSTGIAGLSDTLRALAEECYLLTPQLSDVVSAADLQQAASANQTLHSNAPGDVELNDPPAGLKGKLPYYTAYNWRRGGDPFLPLYIWWQSDYRFSQRYSQATQSYPPDFLKQFRLGQYQVELQPTAEAMPNFTPGGSALSNFSVHGLISLSSASTSSLCSQIQIYCRTYLNYDPASGPPDKSHPDFDEVSKFYASYQDYKTRNVLSQGLSGFNSGLVQRAQELQIPITIPRSWTAADQHNFPLANFWPTSFLHRQSADWPVTWNDEGINFKAFAKGGSEVYFNPLRAGFLRISQITLVDAFGRFVDLKTPNPKIVSENMIADQPAPDNHGIYLAPRLMQPARVDFEWIAAESPSGIASFPEPGDQPAASPVRGWIWPNHLDDSLMLYDAAGRPMGSLRTRETRLHWFPVPGETTEPGAVNRDQMLAYFAGKNVNPVFRDFVAKYLYPDESVAADAKFRNVLEVLRKSQQFIVTAAMQQDQALGMFMGRPLVIAQSMISLAQKGLPYVGLNAHTYPEWNKFGPQFTVTASNYIPYDFGNFNQAGIAGLEVPVRIGIAEIQTKGGTSIPHFDDGVAGYFLAEDWGTLYTPVDMADSDGIVSVAASRSHPLSLTPNGPEATLTLVMDPRAAVHATTGILPVRSLTIPPDQFARILDQLEITFLTAPLLVAQDPPLIPLPAEQDYDWSWVEVGAAPLPLRPAQGAADAVFPGIPRRLVDGWLKLHQRNNE